MFHRIVIQNEETRIHSCWQIIVLFNCYWSLVLHYVSMTSLLLTAFTSHEKMIHLLLFFSSILHSLQVPIKERRPSCSCLTCEGDSLNLMRRYEVHLLYLLLEILGQVIFLFTLLERIRYENLVIFRGSLLRDSSRFTVEFGFNCALNERWTLEAVHTKKPISYD